MYNMFIKHQTFKVLIIKRKVFASMTVNKSHINSKKH